MYQMKKFIDIGQSMILGQLIVSRQLTDPGVNFARSDACNCSHVFFVSPGQLWEAGYPLYNDG